MASAVERAMGIVFTWNSVAVALLTNPGEVTVEADEEEITNHDSELGAREFAASLTDPGELDIEGYFNGHASHMALYADSVSKEIRNWSQDLPSGHSWAGEGWVKKFAITEVEAENFLKFSVTLRLTGAPTFTEGGGS